MTSDGAEKPAAIPDHRGRHRALRQARLPRDDDAGDRRCAGIRKASLYYYFRSKEDILVELHETLMTVVIRQHSDRLAAGRLGPPDLPARP
ncbi:TetR family transcriptional regulator [Pseudonocardia kunmingensis]|uniref:TetR family transcriptional regulator n=1 Tax=Pseudonocardia kunmingensis TaxID=630975 RepID=UPI0014782286|nr:TetR family transcriptional regulator [Pseudonocardia kunmingensis]